MDRKLPEATPQEGEVATDPEVAEQTGGISPLQDVRMDDFGHKEAIGRLGSGRRDALQRPFNPIDNVEASSSNQGIRKKDGGQNIGRLR